MDVECVWKNKINCQRYNNDNTIDVGLSCDECDWKELEYDKNKIIDRIGIETKKMRKLYFIAKQRKAQEIKDLMMGIMKMYEILEKDFGIKNVVGFDLLKAMRTNANELKLEDLRSV